MPTIQIFSTGAAGSPETVGTEVLPIPARVVAITPPAGTPISLVTPLSWMVLFPAVPLVVEASDANREVVLSCEPIDDGGYAIPLQAQQAYAAQTRTDPQIVEIRRDAETTARAYVRGVGYVPLTIRTSWGPRFPLTP